MSQDRRSRRKIFIFNLDLLSEVPTLSSIVNLLKCLTPKLFLFFKSFKLIYILGTVCPTKDFNETLFQNRIVDLIRFTVHINIIIVMWFVHGLYINICIIFGVIYTPYVIIQTENPTEGPMMFLNN